MNSEVNSEQNDLELNSEKSLTGFYPKFKNPSGLVLM